MNCCRVRPERAAIHELVGPEPVTQRDLLAAVGQIMGHVVAVGSVPVALVALFQFGLGAEFAAAVGVYTVIQLLDGNLLAPLLISEIVDSVLSEVKA